MNNLEKHIIFLFHLANSESSENRYGEMNEMLKQS